MPIHSFRSVFKLFEPHFHNLQIKICQKTTKNFIRKLILWRNATTSKRTQIFSFLIVVFIKTRDIFNENLMIARGGLSKYINSYRPYLQKLGG